MFKVLRKAIPGGDSARFYQASLDELAAQPTLRPTDVEAPWSVAFYYDAPTWSDRMNRLAGGGVLISDRWVLTCAHIFSDDQRKRDEPPLAEKNFFARIGGRELHAGTVRRINTPVPGPFRLRRASRLPGPVGDICLVELVDSVDLPSLRLATTPAQVGQNVKSFGWPGGNDGPGVLHELHSTIVDPRSGINQLIGHGELCAAIPENCALGPGFSGYPVITLPDTTDDDEPEVVGLISHGPVEQLPYAVPMILTDITAHLAWITATTSGVVTAC